MRAGTKKTLGLYWTKQPPLSPPTTITIVNTPISFFPNGMAKQAKPRPSPKKLPPSFRSPTLRLPITKSPASSLVSVIKSATLSRACPGLVSRMATKTRYVSTAPRNSNPIASPICPTSRETRLPLNKPSPPFNKEEATSSGAAEPTSTPPATGPINPNPRMNGPNLSANSALFLCGLCVNPSSYSSPKPKTNNLKLKTPSLPPRHNPIQRFTHLLLQIRPWNGLPRQHLIPHRRVIHKNRLHQRRLCQILRLQPLVHIHVRMVRS